MPFPSPCNHWFCLFLSEIFSHTISGYIYNTKEKWLYSSFDTMAVNFVTQSQKVSLLKSWLIFHCLHTLSVQLSIYKWFGYFLILTVGDDSTLNMRMQISARVVHYFSLGVPYVCVCIVWHLIVWQFYFDDLRKFFRHSLVVESVYICVQQYTKVLFALYPQWHF